MVEQVASDYNKAQENYREAWNGLHKNFKTDLQSVVQDVNNSLHKVKTFNGNIKKFGESMGKLEEVLNAAREQERPQQAVSENLDKKANESLPEEEEKE